MAQLMLINPRKRRATKRKTATSRKRRTYKRASAPATSIVRRRRSALRGIARRSRRVRRNPIGVNGIVGMVTDAGIGAAGAIGVDLLFNALPLPVNLKAGYAGTAAKAATAILVGTVGKKVLGRTAEKLAAGALVVQAYQLLQSFMPISAPSLGFVNAGMNAGYMPQSTMGLELDGLGEYVGQPAYSYNGSGMGEYIQ